MAAVPSDKRGFIRVPFNTTVEVRTPGGTIRSQEGINISMSGIRLSTQDNIPPAETGCEVAIMLGGKENPLIIDVRGKTVRSQAGSLAIEFSELGIESYQHLRQLIVNNAGDPTRAEQEFSDHWGIRPPRRETRGS